MRLQKPIKLIKEEPGGNSEESVKIWCHQCKEKVVVIDPNYVIIEIKKNSKRKFLTGKCNKCNRKVSGIVKSS